jgi:hypothetical protein
MQQDNFKLNENITTNALEKNFILYRQNFCLTKKKQFYLISLCEEVF